MARAQCFVAVFIVLLLTLHAADSAAQSRVQTGVSTGVRRALLVGINTYQPAGTTAQHPQGCSGGRCDLPVFPNLQGPIYDVAAVRDLLSSPKFDFEPKNITILTDPALPRSPLPYVTLPASQTTHNGLLAVLRKYLVDLPHPGDTVVFYYAGHGSLRINSKGDKMTMLYNGKPSHADSTLVPSDAWTGGYDIRDREMTDIFNAALNKGIHLTVLFDSCHSGAFTRGLELGPKYTERSLSYDPRDIDQGPELQANGTDVQSPAAREKNPALIFSAAQQDQTAKEGNFTDAPNSEHHGAFTLALLRTLETLPADTPASDVNRQVRAMLEAEGVDDQTPAMDTTGDRMSQPLFGGTASGTGQTRAAVIGVDDDGTVLLDAGKLSNINVGSEFTSLPGANGSAPILLRVKELEGITNSRCVVVSPAGAKVALSQLFTLSKWIPDPLDTLHFWTWPANLSYEQINAAVAQVRASGVTTIADPAEEPWTDMLAWNGTAWELRHPEKTSKTTLGPALTAASLMPLRAMGTRVCVNDPVTDAERKILAGVRDVAAEYKADPKACETFLLKQNGVWTLQHIESAKVQAVGAHLSATALRRDLPRNAKLWVNLPPPQELAAKLDLHNSTSLVQGVEDAAKAEYLLVGTLNNGAPEWGWYHKEEYALGPRAAVSTDHTPGCSTTSKYPVRTAWAAAPQAASLAQAGATLDTYASRLAKLNGWLQLVGSPDNATDADNYHLELKRLTDNVPVSQTVAAPSGEHLVMYLKADDTVYEKRWVYVLDINCQGESTLLYPLYPGENQFPNDADTPLEFAIPGIKPLHVDGPYGVDSVLMISTQEPLPDPSLLNFEGVGDRGASRGLESPLEQLLTNASTGTRGIGVTNVPTNWMIQSSVLRTTP